MAQETQGAGVFVTWPALAITGALIVSLVTGAIQLGGVQTYVIINTGRLDRMEARERLVLERVARTEARQIINEDRIKSLEGLIISSRGTDNVIVDRLGKIEARLSGIEVKIGGGRQP